MHGDYPGFIPKEALPEENLNNVKEFIHHEKPAEHAVAHIRKEAGLHEAPVLLSKTELAEAEAERDKLQNLHKQILTSVNKGLITIGFGKKKARESNKSMDVKNLPDISRRLKKLESNIAFTKASADPISKDAFDKLSPHKKSMLILKEAGYDSIAQARATNPDKDSTLARMIRTATMTAAKEGVIEESNVVHVPESVWPGPEPKKGKEQKPGEMPEAPKEEIRKAA